MGRPESDEEQVLLAHAYKSQQTISGSKYPPVEEDVHALSRESMACNVDPAGVALQMATIIASGDRVADLAKVSTPTLVIHGTEDPLVRFPVDKTPPNVNQTPN
jgi:pimeloyl-ACP methyl ester carboxylesterase